MDIANLQTTIQAYLDKTLPPQEIRSFEALMAQSAEVREAVNQFRQLRIVQGNAQLIEGQAILRQVMSDTPINPDDAPTEVSPRPWWQRYRWLALGTAAVLTVLAVAILTTTRTNERMEAANKAKTALAPLENFINFAPNDPSIAAEGMRAYDAGQYAQAAQLLHTAIGEQNPPDNSLVLYQGISEAMSEQWKGALATLSPVALGDDLAATPAKWYLALCYLHENDRAAAIGLLSGLKTDPVFGPKVQDILRAQ
jgi:hypothetical protein